MLQSLQFSAVAAGLDPLHWSVVGPGGVLRFELDRGVPLEPQNPYPSLRVILAEKGTHF